MKRKEDKRVYFKQLIFGRNETETSNEKREKEDYEMIKINEDTKCFYQPGESGIVDVARPDGKSAIDKEDLTAICKRYPGAVLMPFNEACRQADAAKRARLCTGAHEITEEKWIYALEVLPPMDWVRHQGSESFKMSELTSGNLTAIYCRIGDKYYTLTEDVKMPHDKIIEICRAKYWKQYKQIKEG